MVLPAAAGRGGRATHLALLVARELAELPAPLRSRVAFLAAGTDDRDGNTDVSGAIVDGTTWERARARGLDPAAALRAYDSLPVLAAIGDTLRGPGTSNLLDLHLLHRAVNSLSRFTCPAALDSITFGRCENVSPVGPPSRRPRSGSRRFRR